MAKLIKFTNRSQQSTKNVDAPGTTVEAISLVDTKRIIAGTDRAMRTNKALAVVVAMRKVPNLPCRAYKIEFQGNDKAMLQNLSLFHLVILVLLERS